MFSKTGVFYSKAVTLYTNCSISLKILLILLTHELTDLIHFLVLFKAFFYRLTEYVCV